MKAAEISVALRDRIESLAVDLVGEGPTYRGRMGWRFYPRGGLVVTIAGEKRGLWYDFSSGQGGDPLDLIKRLRSCSTAEAMEWARDWLGTPEHEKLGSKPRHEPARESGRLELAKCVWRESVPAQGTLAKAYLASRGLMLPGSPVLRFHPACPRGAERLPAMVAFMTDPVTNKACGVHRTFLRPDGKGKVGHGTAKMMAGHAGIIRLVADEDVGLGLGLAEGIETALAVMQHAGWESVWACGSAGGVARFPVLGGIECVTIFADHDDAGQSLKAARECAERWIAAGREAVITLPPSGNDWLDALLPREAA